MENYNVIKTATQNLKQFNQQGEIWTTTLCRSNLKISLVVFTQLNKQSKSVSLVRIALPFKAEDSL